jgi:hypothetical protein
VRRAFAALAACCAIAASGHLVAARDLPPAAAVPAPGSPLPAAAPDASPEASPGASPAAPEETPGASPTPTPAPTPTPVPIVVDPPQPIIEIDRSLTARINGAAGTIAVTVADPAIATATVDQGQRTLTITGHAVGTTTVTVSDERGMTRDVPVRIAYTAGSIPSSMNVRVTGDPAARAFLRDAIAQALTRAATLRPGGRITVYTDTIDLRSDLPIDNLRDVDARVQLAGEGYLAVNATVRIHLENVALPRVRPGQLLVSDYPERLTADGVLFTATLDTGAAQRFLYYHYNPPTEPARRVLLKIANTGATAAQLQVIESLSGPGSNELEVGHNATRGFLVRERRNEGTVVTIPPNATVNLVDHPLPQGMLVNGILQLREVAGFPLQVVLVAQEANAPLDRSVDATSLLSGGAPHARGVYPVPDFFADYTYDVEGNDLEIPIGQLPLPNLREGEALSGDYGVRQSARIVIVNSTRNPRSVALYANPRGGGATGTFLIDNTLVQAHRLPPFSKYKLWQETVGPGSYRTLRVVTMPEGGSSYPLRLIVAPDDGSVAPNTPQSPVY